MKEKDKQLNADSERIGKELREMYDDGEEEDMGTIVKAQRSTLTRILIGIIVFFGLLAAVSWAGFFFFSPARHAVEGEGVSVTIDGPDTFTSGAPVKYMIHYKNSESIPLGTASLDVRLPKEFQVTSTQPPSDSKTWLLGSVSPGKQGDIEIDGIAIAPLQKQLDIQAILTYQPSDFNSEFQKVTTKVVSANDSILTVAVTGPDTALPGDKQSFIVKYANTSAQDVANVRLILVPPPTFIIDSSAPNSKDPQHTEWDIDSLKANASGSITVFGSFTADAKGKQDMQAQIGVTDDSGAILTQNTSTFSTDAQAGDLLTTLILNGKSDAQTANFGDTLHYAVTYHNNGNAKLEDVSFTIRFDTQPTGSSLLDWKNLHDAQQGTRDTSSITWTKKQVPSLATLSPNDEGSINFDIPLFKQPSDAVPGQNYGVTAVVETLIKTADGQKVMRTVKTQPVTASILSDTDLASTARYYDQSGTPVGSGPIPPKSGAATTYRVNWTVTNSLHELSDLKISSALSPGVIWTGKSSVDAGALTFDASSGKMIWTLNWLPLSVKTLHISFDVTLTPTSDQVGSIASITDATILEATDKLINQPLIVSTPPLTTMLDGDTTALGKGRVQK